MFCYIDKVNRIRSDIVLVGNAIANKINLSHCLRKLELITLAQLENIILHLKPTNSLHVILPSRLFKEVVDTIGPIYLW